MRTLITLVLTLILFASVAVAQSKKDKIEIGVQSTSLTIFPPDIPFDETKGAFTVPSVTRHNLQVSSGIGFRF